MCFATGVMVKARDYHAEDLGSNPAPEKLKKCEFFLRKGSIALDPEMNYPMLKISLIQVKKINADRQSESAQLTTSIPGWFIKLSTGRRIIRRQINKNVIHL